MLLSNSESEFVNATSDILGDYYESELLGNTLMKCTNNQLKKEKYLDQYTAFQKCLGRKIAQSVISVEHRLDRGGLFPHERDIISLQIIDKSLIVKAMHKGFKHLSKLTKNGSTDINQLFIIICRIVAKTNLDYKFK